MTWYRFVDDRLVLTLHIQPGAKKTEVVGLHGEALKIRVAAPPIEGAANEALVKFVAGLCGVSRRQVSIKAGASSRHKIVEVLGSAIDQESLNKLFTVAS
jgi:hypothetical protein